MWQFAEAVRGLADGCRQLGTPVTGGNVSLYNQTGEAAIHPTPVVAVLGVIDDVARRTPVALPGGGPAPLPARRHPRGVRRLGLVRVIHDHLGGLPPQVDLEREKLLAEILISASRDGMIDSAHDLSDGGLVQAVVESALLGGKGARLIVPDGLDASASCSPSRPAARSSPYRARRSCGCAGHVRCAGPARPPASVWSAGTRSRSRASSRSP
ncbi:Phosphoribosylformylglycinamidine synthase subunit PurL OS=Streptomyces fumanus OX=67302 GN=purL PE=3 SV=1 [Streptomyces fumanus]